MTGYVSESGVPEGSGRAIATIQKQGDVYKFNMDMAKLNKENILLISDPRLSSANTEIYKTGLPVAKNLNR